MAIKHFTFCPYPHPPLLHISMICKPPVLLHIKYKTTHFNQAGIYFMKKENSSSWKLMPFVKWKRDKCLFVYWHTNPYHFIAYRQKISKILTFIHFLHILYSSFSLKKLNFLFKIILCLIIVPVLEFLHFYMRKCLYFWSNKQS